MRREANLHAFDTLLNPGALDGIGNVHVLDADGAAISAPQNVEHLTQSGEFKPEHTADINGPVVVDLGEAIAGRPELWVLAPRGEFQRVELGDEMATRAIGADQQAHT